jgi:transposase
LWIGDAAEIRTKRVRKQKTDRQDALLLLRLLLEDRFPRIWVVASGENRDLRQLLWHRHRMVQTRTRLMNQLQAVALNEGLRCKKRLWREVGGEQLEGFRLAPWASRRRRDLLELLDRLNPTIAELTEAIEQEVEKSPRDPGAAKPYNFALSPILVQPPPDCTLIGPANNHSEEWLTQAYTEIHSGETVTLSSEYNGKILSPQTLSNVIWRHYLHPEDKSLSPDGEPCNAYTRGLLLRRPIKAMIPFIPIGKEIERRAQEGEDVSILGNTGPIQYHRQQTARTRAADAGLILRARRFPLRKLMRESRASQHAVTRFLRGDRVHPATRARLARTVDNLEREVLRARSN